MGGARRTAIGSAMAVLVSAAVIGLTPSAASACSFVPPTLGLIGHYPDGTPFRVPGLMAGAPMTITGMGFFTVDGELLPDCSGDYDFVSQPPVTLVIDYTTLSGPRSTAVVAEVSDARIPREDADDALADQFHISVDVPIPADATSVVVHAGSVEAASDIEGAVPTTVPAGNGGSDATPAAPVSGNATFTG